MSKSKKVGFGRPNLRVEISDFHHRLDDFKDTERRNEVALKPLRSAKNLHELRNFNFDPTAIDTINADRRFKKLQQLEKEKQQLLQSLEILKTSAVSAIVEKEEEIERLRERDHIGSDENIQFFEGELALSRRVRDELQEEREQLHREMCQERSKYIAQLEEKQYLIQQLHEEIMQARETIDQLNLTQQAKDHRIKLLTEENHSLAHELEMSFSTIHCRERGEFEDTQKGQSQLSVSSSIPNRSCSFILQADHHFQNEADRTYISEKMEEIERTHKEELLDLRCYYEKRINGLRDIYERELRLPTEESISENRSSALSRKRSNRQRCREGLQLNIRDMYAIQENAEKEIETSRSKVHDLQYEIKMKNLSECPSVEQQMLTNQDAESQFTTKYFENPFRFTKNRSAQSLLAYQQAETISLQNAPKDKLIKEDSKAKNKGVEEESGWGKPYVFAAGLLSGVTISSLVGYFLRPFR